LEDRRVQIGRAVTVHVAIASPNFPMAVVVGEQPGKHAEDELGDNACKDRDLAWNGNSVTFWHVRYHKLARTLTVKLESSMARLTALFVRLQSQTCFSHLFDLSRVCECCVFHNLPCHRLASLQQTLESA
jgi:hypothetical protein